MNQQNLYSEIERIVDYWKTMYSAQLRDVWGVSNTELQIQEDKLREFLKSIAEKTVEVVRVEKRTCEHDSRSHCLENECYLYETNGYAEAEANQTKKAAQWLGKE